MNTMLLMTNLQRKKHESHRYRLYRFFHHIVRTEDIPTRVYVLLVIVETFQLLHYSVHESYSGLWNSQLQTALALLFGYSDLSRLWVVFGEYAIMVFVSVCLLAYVLAILVILYECNKKEEVGEISVTSLKYITWLAILTKTVLVLPCTLGCMTWLRPNKYSIGALLVPISLISTLGFIAMLLCLWLFIMFVRDNSPFSTFKLACSVNNNEQIRTGIKMAIAIYGAAVGDGFSYSSIFCIVYAGALGLLNVTHFRQAGYLYTPFSWLMCVGPMITVWFCLASQFQQHSSSNEFVGIVLAVLGIPLSIFLWLHLHEGQLNRLMFSSYKNLSSSDDLLIYNYQCIRLVNELSVMGNLIILQGILNHHILHCKKKADMCVCHRIRASMTGYRLDGERADIAEEKKLWFEFIKSNLTEIKEKYCSVAEISFLLAYIEHTQLYNLFKALHNLQQKSHFKNQKCEFLNYHCLRQIQRKMIDGDRMRNENKPVDVNRYYDFEMHYGQLEQLVQQFAYDTLAFWQSLAAGNTTRGELYQRGRQVHDNLQSIQQLYGHLSQINPNNLMCLMLYSNAMKAIANKHQIYERNIVAIDAIKRTLANNSRIQNDPDRAKYGENSNSGIVIISGQRKNIGIIKHCSSKIIDQINYAPHELLGQNINKLMPTFIGNMHDDVLKNYLELSESKFDFVERLAPIITKSSFLVLTRILTKPLPSLINGLELVGIFFRLMEQHPRHPGQLPKYLLYRSDTGEVQGLSQSCFKQFKYKINPITAVHEESSNLFISSLFPDVNDTQIISEEKGVEGTILMQSTNKQVIDTQISMKIQIYLRHEFNYFGVKMRLLEFFTRKSYRQFIVNDQLGQETYKEGRMLQEKIDPNLKELYYGQVVRKKMSVDGQPLVYKLLNKFGAVFFIIVLIFCIAYAILASQQSSNMSNYLRLSSLTSESYGSIAQIVFFARLLHLSAGSPSYFPESRAYITNITLNTNQLQDQQFQIGSLSLALGSQNQSSSMGNISSWRINQAGKVTAYQTTLDANIFEFVTSASSYQKATPASLTFPLKLLSAGSRTYSSNQFYINLFQLRYTGLFETLPKKNVSIVQVQQLFSSIFDNECWRDNIKMALVLVFLVLSVVVIVVLTLLIVALAENHLMIFGCLTISEVQFEVWKRYVFLEVFFQRSYRIQLSRKDRDISVSTDELSHSNKPFEETSEGSHTKNLKGSLSELDKLQQQTEINECVDRIEQQTKQFQARTTKHIGMDKVILQGVDEGQSMLKLGQVDSVQATVQQKLSKNGDNTRWKIVVLDLCIFCIAAVYFVVAGQVVTDYRGQLITSINNVRLIYANLNLIKAVKLYTLESVVDGSSFSSYTLLNKSLQGYYNQLYETQKQLDVIASAGQTGPTTFQFYSSDLCDNGTLEQLRTVNQTLFDNSSFSSTQCTSILDGILKQGLRISVIAFAQNMINFTRQDNSSVLTVQFKEILAMQKYLQTPYLAYVKQYSLYVQQLIGVRNNLLIWSAVVFAVIFIGCFLAIWRPILGRLLERLKITRQILGWIPMRALAKNKRLTAQYDRFIEESNK